MGSGKTSKPNKSSKPPLSPPEPSGTPNTPPFPDLPNSSQASYGGGATPPRLASNAAETGSASVSVPALGIDLWNASPGSEGRKLQPTPQSSAAMNQQDERELKRQKRKQSNRESARRSRLRKQAECEELQHRVDALTNENHTLQEELRSLWNECEKLESENTSLKEELTMFCSPKVASDLDNSRSPSPENGGNL